MIIPATFAPLGSIDRATHVPNYEIRFKRDEYGPLLGLSSKGTRDILIDIDGATFSATLSRSNHEYIYTLAKYQNLNDGAVTKVGELLYQKLVLSRGDQTGLTQSISIELEVTSASEAISDPLRPALEMMLLHPSLMNPGRMECKLSNDETGDMELAAGSHSTVGVFGDAETNRKVELFAMDAATQFYTNKGWEARDVSHDKLGYDIECLRANKRLLVEVKGSRGDLERFVVTANEVRASAFPEFELCIVRLALSDDFHISTYTGAEFRELFSLSPLQYIARRKASN